MAQSPHQPVTKAIIITGTPGTGKSTLARRLSKALGFQGIDVNRLVKVKKLYSSYDKKCQSYVVNEHKLIFYLISLIKTSNKLLIIDSHLSQVLPQKYVSLAIITNCALPQLKQRLIKRGYTMAKVQENLQSEVFDICAYEAQERGYSLIRVDTTRLINIPNLTKKIKKFI